MYSAQKTIRQFNVFVMTKEELIKQEQDIEESKNAKKNINNNLAMNDEEVEKDEIIVYD